MSMICQVLRVSPKQVGLLRSDPSLATEIVEAIENAGALSPRVSCLAPLIW
jgi:hypothetical protein